MHIKLSNGTPEKYTIAQLRRDYSQVSFPEVIPDETLAEYQVYPLQPTDAPVVDHRKNVAEALAVEHAGAWVQAWEVTDATADEIAQRTAEKADEVRADRNQRLTACDWTQVDDSPVTNAQKLEWATYRQALRDLSAQAGFPWSVQWPEKPVA